MRFALMLPLAAVLCCLSGALAAPADDEFYMPRGVKPAVQEFVRDCPMCGWSPFKKRSNDKPSERFAGAFKPGDTCPFCGGKGKITESINWARGYAEACGVGAPEERSAIEDPKRRKAFEVLQAKGGGQRVALRNAVKLLANLRLDAGKMANTANYVQKIEATVKGFETLKVKENSEADLPYYIAKVRIPLWGVKGLTSSFWQTYSQAYGAKKHAAAPRSDLEEEYVIVIDARGTGCEPHLFPRVVTGKGDVVYDVASVSKEAAEKNGMARFGNLAGDVPFDKLQESLKESSLSRTGHYAYWDEDEGTVVFDDDEEGKEGDDEKDTPKKRKRKRINLVVKGEKSENKDASVEVSEEDAKKMKEADGKTDSLKGAKVIVLTDSRVAGKEGRLHVPRSTRLACRTCPGGPDAR
jgi:hypothetical protein